MERVLHTTEKPGFRPLYQQVRDVLLAQISAGAWRHSEPLPSETALADSLGVSQGTVRKALDSLVAENLVERRQGKGTFLARHTQESAQFRFFKLRTEDGARAVPTCETSTVTRRAARAPERRALDLPARADVFVVERTRLVDDAPALLESITLSAALFSGLDAHQPLPNTLYTFYQSVYSVSIIGATERLRACKADARAAASLNCQPGAPVLCVERVAHDIARRPVELRSTLCLTEALHYGVELG